MEAETIRCAGDSTDNLITDNEVGNLNVDSKDMILTPATCSCLVNDILKALLYQKCQIPYPYSWLKNSLCKRNTEPDIHPHNISIVIHKYYNIAFCAKKAVEEITSNLSTIFTSSTSVVQEIVILFGSTPYTPKEVFTIKLPSIAKGHLETNHRSMLHKKQHSILKTIFLSDEWLAAISHQLPVTNTYIMVKKAGVLRHEDDYFEHYNNFVVPATIRNTTICLNYDKKFENCCDNLRVFADFDSDLELFSSPALPLRNVEWYQAKGIIKGFKDFFIEKVSVSELW